MKKLLYILFVPLALFGQDNYSLSFDDNIDIVYLPSMSIQNDEASWFTRIKVDSIIDLNSAHILSKYNTSNNSRVFTIEINNGVISANLWDLNISNWISVYDTNSVEINEWIDITVNLSYSSPNNYYLSLYKNGILADSNEHSGNTLLAESENYSISDDIWDQFHGKIDLISIYEKSLTESEIQEYMICPSILDEEGLLGFWNFNEGSGDTVYDLSGNGNHGVINGASYSDDVPEQNCEVSQSDGLVLAEALTEGLIAYYPFNGNANDESSNGNHGEVINATLIDDRFGAPNNAYEFDADYQFTNGGSESYIQLPEISTNIGAPNSSFSISMWFRCYDPSTPGNIILNSGGEGISTIVGRVGVSGNVIDIYHRNPSTNNEPNGSINIDSNWNNVIVIVDGELGEYKLFVNGNIDNSMTFSFDANETYFNEERTWQIGGISYAGSNNHQFHGAIDDISFWGRTLTDDEIHVLSSNNILYGCTSLGSPNYNPFANSDDNSCVTYQYLTNSIDSLQTELANLNEQATTSLSSLQQALDTWNTTIDLSAGWNMFGYGCPTSIGVAEGLSNHTESIIITKDNSGNVYMPEFGFNGIGDFTPGFGYQIKLIDAIESFSLCDWYVNDIPEDNIVSLQEENASLQAELDCYENPQVGDYCFGGIVFYVNETGKYGLVSALEDLTEGAFVHGEGMIGYEWGCYGQVVNGAEMTSVGSGHQNTIDIIIQECTTVDGGIVAAQAVFDAEINGYSDWYLPSKDELQEMYHTIGIGGVQGNIGDFDDLWSYWSSSELDSNHVWGLEFGNGLPPEFPTKISTYSVRPIRSFGNWTMGCMNSLACNFNTEANMSDGSCTYAQEGYDCDGNIQTSLSFDGIDDWIDINSFITDSDIDLTIHICAKGSSGTFLSTKTNSYETYFSYSNSNFENAIVYHNGQSNVPTKHWDVSNFDYLSSDFHFYSLTLNTENGSTISELFLNGISLGEHIFSNPVLASTEIEIGRNIVEENGLFDGSILEIQIWDSVLTQEQIQSLMCVSPSGEEQALLGYWNFNEGQGDTVYDLSENGNHGTINGALYSTDVPENNCE